VKIPLFDLLDRITIQSAQRHRRYHLFTANINAFKTTIEKYWRLYRFVVPDPSTATGAAFTGIARHSDRSVSGALVSKKGVELTCNTSD
jgi:hypothetical protein